MKTTDSKSPYSRINSLESALVTDASDAVELQSLRNEDNSEEQKHNAKVTHLEQPQSLFPWQGAAALILIVLLTAAAVGVLLASSGSPIERWRVGSVQIQPQVWLSVLVTITDGLTMFALAKAAEITYWRATARGTTLRNLYDLYESQFFLGAINNLVHLRGNELAVVSVLCLVSALRGPLFQRASVVVSNATRGTHGVQRLDVAQLIPPNFLYEGSAGSSALYDVVYNAYIERAPIHANVNEEECGDICHGKVKGYGFDINCSDVSTIPRDSSGNSTVRQKYQDAGNRIGGAVPSFNSSANLLGGVLDREIGDSAFTKEFIAAEQQGWFEVVNLFKTQPICGGDLSLHQCSLHHAVVEYEVSLKNETMSLSRDNWQDDNVLFHTPTWTTARFYEETDWGPTTHWVSWYQAEFNEEVSMYPDREGGPCAGSNVRFLLAKRFINGNINAINCNTTFGDPTQFVLNRLREMAFRTAVAAAGIADPVVLFGSAALAQEGLPLAQNWTQDITVTGKRSTVAYGVSVPYLVCAIVCSLLAVVAIAPLYWKARSERLVPLSFNTLDVARMFDAPLLQDAYEKDIEGYVRKEKGLRRVRCGVKGLDTSEGMVAARVIFND